MSGLQPASNRRRLPVLLVLHGDRILVERYQHDPEQRFHSQSIAKTLVAMMAGIALHEGKIRSIDELAQEYVPALADLPYGKTSLRHLRSAANCFNVVTSIAGCTTIR